MRKMLILQETASPSVAHLLSCGLAAKTVATTGLSMEKGEPIVLTNWILTEYTYKKTCAYPNRSDIHMCWNNRYNNMRKRYPNNQLMCWGTITSRNCIQKSNLQYDKKHVMIMADQEPNGIHNTGLIIGHIYLVQRMTALWYANDKIRETGGK